MITRASQSPMHAHNLLVGVPPQRRAAASPVLLQRRAGKVTAIAAEPATAPLTRDDLIKYLASGCKPRDKWR